MAGVSLTTTTTIITRKTTKSITDWVTTPSEIAFPKGKAEDLKIWKIGYCLEETDIWLMSFAFTSALVICREWEYL